MNKLLLLFTFLVLQLGLMAQSVDLALNQITIPQTVNIVNSPIKAEAIIRNIGATTVTSFDVGFSVDGGPVSIFTLAGLNLAQGDNYNLTRINAWDVEGLGAFTITMWVTNVNGGAVDANPLNDTLSKTIEAVDESVDRNTFNEIFTSSTCPPCRPGNINTDNVWSNSNRTPVIIKYQMSWPGTGDPYYTTEGNSRRNYYGVNSVPYMTIDGGWNGNANSYTNSVLEQFSNIPSFLDIESNFTVSGNTVDVEIGIEPLKELLGNNRLHVAIIEKTTFNNVKSNGETEFHDVMKKMLPNQNGTTLGNISLGQPLTYEFSYTFQGNYRLPANANSPINNSNEHSVEEFTDLGVVVWVQNQSNRDVYHAAYSEDKSTNLDLSFNSLTTASNVQVNQSTPIEGIVVNNQFTQITSFDVVYRINGGIENRQNVTGVTLSKGDSMMFSHSTPWVPSNTGFYKVEARIDNVNGAGMNTSDDLTVNDRAFKYVIVSTQVGNLPVYEVAKTISVYPNPSNGLIQINSLSDFANSVEVYSLMGEKITSKMLGAKGLYDLNLMNEKAGMYILRFNTIDGVFSKSIIIN